MRTLEDRPRRPDGSEGVQLSKRLPESSCSEIHLTRSNEPEKLSHLFSRAFCDQINLG